jgi:hypothetical protein
LQHEGRIDDEHADMLREQYEHKRDLQSNPDDGAKRDHIAKHVTIESELIEAQRRAVIAMRERGEIDNVVLRRVQSDLDLAATRKARV